MNEKEELALLRDMFENIPGGAFTYEADGDQRFIYDRREHPDEEAAGALLEEDHVEDVDADRVALECRPKPRDGGQDRRKGIRTLLL